MTDLLSAINVRVSAMRLTDPAPTDEELQNILRAGARAPDHGRLTPWRFTVIEGTARLKLGDAMARHLQERNSAATADKLAQESAKALRAPLIIVAGAHVTMPSKIPEIEQVMAVAAGVQNILLVSQSLGYGAMWKTGGIAYDNELKKLVGLEPQDHIVGFIYIGTATKAPPVRTVDIGPLITRL